MSGPKSSNYDVTAEVRHRLKEEARRREEEERHRREEEERRRREEEERRRREEEERRRREEEERRRREEEERRRREEEERRRKEEARKTRIRQSNAVIDQAFANFSFMVDELEKIVEPENPKPENKFDGSEFSARLNSLLINSRLSDELTAKVAATKRNFESITDSTYRKNFSALSITPLLKECAVYLQLYEKVSALKLEYEVVCSMAGEPAKPIEISQTAIQDLQNEIARLREKIAHDDEKAYIRKCLDEVMSDMGYDVIGSREVMKKSGRHFKNELFSYADGTAVNVTLADDGSVAMELCGLDEVDRTPEFSESEKLCEHMEAFCEDFDEIERRLAEKGVVLSHRIQRLPPSAEYAQILNVRDYTLNGTVEHFSHQRRRDNTSRPLQRKNL